MEEPSKVEDQEEIELEREKIEILKSKRVAERDFARMRSSIALSTIATTTPYCHYRLCNSSLLQVIIFSLILLLI